MKRVLAIAAIAVLIVSCNKNSDPKTVSSEFVKALFLLDYDKASTLATSDTKEVIAKKEVQPMDPTNTNRTPQKADEEFLLSSLQQNVSDNSAEVKNDLLTLSLKKEEDGWKVVADKAVIDNIINRVEKVAALKLKWEALQKAYESRNSIAKDYINHISSKGPLTQQAKALNDALAKVKVPDSLSSAQLANYIQQQEALTPLIDKAVVPSLTANTDMTANYIIQLNMANTNIETVRKEYNQAAQNTRSNVYTQVAEKTKS